MTHPLTIAEVEALRDARRADDEYLYSPHVRDLATQLADTMRENEKLREALQFYIDVACVGRSVGEWNEAYDRASAALAPFTKDRTDGQ